MGQACALPHTLAPLLVPRWALVASEFGTHTLNLSRPVNISQYPSQHAVISHHSPRPIALGGLLLGPAGRRCRGCIANLDPADAAVCAGSSGEGIGTILTSRQAVLVHSSLILSTYDCFCIPAVYNGNARKQAVFASPNGYNCGNSGRCERHFWHVKPMRLSSAIVITT